MGYFTRPGSLGHTIQCFEPDNSATELWIATGWMSSATSLGELIALARSHFREDVDISQLTITAHHIHTDCIGYDCYDSGDYTDYICITYNPAG